MAVSDNDACCAEAAIMQASPFQGIKRGRGGLLECLWLAVKSAGRPRAAKAAPSRARELARRARSCRRQAQKKPPGTSKKFAPVFFYIFWPPGGSAGVVVFSGQPIISKRDFLRRRFFLIFVVLWFWPILAIFWAVDFGHFWRKWGRRFFGATYYF